MIEHKTSASEDKTATQPLRIANPVVIAYLLHLVVPAFLLVDVVSAPLRGQIALRPVVPHTVVGLISALWLVAGLGFFFLNRNRQAFVKRISTPLLSIYSVYLALLLVEAFGRLIGLTAPVPTPYLQPLTRRVIKTNPVLTPGVSGTKRLTINPLGLRGPMPPKRGPAYRIVAIGGSTTICSSLDDSEEWPHVLMSDMNAAQKNLPVWVGNAGGDGWTTIHQTYLMQWLPGVLHFDMAVFLIGGNDLTISLRLRRGLHADVFGKSVGFQGDLPFRNALAIQVSPLSAAHAFDTLIQAGRSGILPDSRPVSSGLRSGTGS